MLVKRDGYRPRTMAVTFVLPATIWANTVHLVGDFNNWDCHSHPLVRVNDRWQVTIELPRGSLYHFRYLLDGIHWCNDWNADHYAANPLGGDNSVLDLADAEKTSWATNAVFAHQQDASKTTEHRDCHTGGKGDGSGA